MGRLDDRLAGAVYVRAHTPTFSVVCPVCKMGVGVRCEDIAGMEIRPHRDRVELGDPAAAVSRLGRELVLAQRSSDKAATARAKLPAGSSRARVTSANAKWMRAAEARDRIAMQLEAARDRANPARPANPT